MQSVVQGVSLVLLALLVAMPVLMLVYGSLRSAPPGLPSDFTFEKYKVLADPELRGLLATTLIVSCGSALLSVAIGLVLALVIVRTNVPAPRLLDSLVIIPAYIAPFIGAIAWIQLLSPEVGYGNQILRRLGLDAINIYSVTGIIWVIALYYAPLAYLYIRPALVNLDASLEESARVTGASPLLTLRRIVIPLITPAILSAGLVVLVQAAGQFGIPSVLGGPVNIEVLSTAIVRSVSHFPADPNTAAVLGLALTAITVLGLVVNGIVVKRRVYVVTGGRAAQQRRSDLGRWRFGAGAVCWLYLLLSVVLPVGAILVASLQPYLSPTSFNVGWTLENYRYVLTFPAIARSIVNSLVLGIGAAVGGTLLAAIVSYFLVRTNRRINVLIEQLSATPIAVPHTVFGLALLWTWVTIPVGVYGSKWILLVAYIALFFPLAMRSTSAAFTQLDVQLEEASRVLGGSWTYTLRRVVAPLLRPAFLSGFTIILYHSVRELSASVLLYSTGNEVMAVAIYDLADEGRYGEVCALSILNIAMTFLIVGVVNRLGGSLRR